MKLIDLQPQFLRFIDDGECVRHGKEQTLEGADGVMFLCPLCFTANGGEVGTHSVICWFEDRVPDDARPGPGRWNPTGTGYADLSFVPGKRSHSIQLLGACGWHGYITNGEVTNA